jgi:hypothetical protein
MTNKVGTDVRLRCALNMARVLSLLTVLQIWGDFQLGMQDLRNRTDMDAKKQYDSDRYRGALARARLGAFEHPGSGGYMVSKVCKP